MDETPVDYCRPPLGVLAVRGADARRFLQGQLSADVIGLRPGELRWAGLHNPQGRTLATLQLLADGDDVLALLPPDRLAAVLPLLRRYLLRAKARVDDETAQWRLRGAFAAAAQVAAAMGAGSPDGRSLIVAADSAATRCWVLQAGTGPSDETADAATAALAWLRWKRCDLAAGLPQVYDATAGHFIAQMLNLDLIGGVAFDKGCYTGQEVIARAHYRGRVKRRMQRFGSASARAADWPPGSAGRLADGRRFEVVDSVDAEAGGCEWLAVTPLGAGAEHVADADPGVASNAAVGERPCADATPLPLPYALPDIATG